jgi:cyclic-di-GMP-binding protein
MPLNLSLPPADPRPANPPETRPAKVFPWLDQALAKDPVEAARVIGDSLAAINRVELGDSKRLELAEKYWASAATLWPQLEKQFSKATHPLSGEALEAAKAALILAHELSVAYKRLLLHESEKRILLSGNRLLIALLHRCLQCVARVLINSYLSYSPVPSKTWLDAHAIYAFARERGLHQHPIASDQPEMTPERVYLQALLLALANPYGFFPGQLHTVIRYLQEFCHWAKLTDVAPVHRMAKAVAIVPVGHDFPPFSANKGGSIEGSKIFLLTFDLAFQIQEQLRALEGGGEVPIGIPKDPAGRLQYVVLLKRLLRQWALPPARQFNRLPSRARVVMCAGLSGVWQYSRGQHAGVAQAPTGLPPLTACQVINHTPAGYALRQIDANPTALRIGDLIALRVEGRQALQVAMVRWFRNTLKGSGLEFGCELLSDSPEAAAAATEDAVDGNLAPVVVLPEDRVTPAASEPSPPQILVPAGTFQVEQGISLKRGGDTGFAVLLKLVDQGPGFELYDFAPVG